MPEDRLKKDILNSISDSYELMEFKLKKELKDSQTVFQKQLNESNLKDKNISKILLELHNNVGSSYGNKVQEILNKYVKNSSQEDREKTNKLLEEMKKSQLVQEKLSHEQMKHERKQALSDPFEAFKQGFEDLKSGGIKSGLSTTFSGLKESFQQNMNFTGITKGLLHGIGLATDMPALNILASEIKADVSQREEDNQKILDLTNSLDDNISEDIGISLNEIKDSIIEDNKEIEDLSSFVTQIESIKDDVSVLPDMYTDLGSILENIRDLNKESLNIISKQYNIDKEQMLIQRDKMDDDLARQSTFEDKSEKIVKQEIKKDEESTGSLFDLISGKKGKIGKLIKKALPMIGKVAGLAAAGTALFGAFKADSSAKEIFDLQKDQELTQGETISARVGGALGMFGFDEKSVAQGTKRLGERIAESSPVSSIRSMFTSGGESTLKSMKEFEDAGIIETSIIGDSQIRNHDALFKLSSEELDKLIAFDDWSDEDLKTLKMLKYQKQRQKEITPKLEQQTLEDLSKPVDEKIVTSNVQQTKTNQNVVQNQQPVIVPVPQNIPSKDKVYTLEDNDLMVQMQLRGIRV